MKCTLIVIAVACVGCFCAVGQAEEAAPGLPITPGALSAPATPSAPSSESATTPAPEENAGATVAPVAEAAPPPPPKPVGDVIKLKGGAELKGVQVLRRTPHGYDVEVAEGVPPLRIPWRQVEKIIFDAYDPLRERRAKQTMSGNPESSLIPGEKLSPDLVKKLSAAISDTPLEYNQRDLVEVLEELSTQLGIAIHVGQPVKDLPPDQRLWTVKLEPGASLMTLLRDHLQKTFAQLDVVYQFDKLLITSKEEALTLRAANTDAAAQATEPQTTPGATGELPAPATSPVLAPGPGASSSPSP